MDKQPCVRAAGLLLGALLIVACSKQPVSEPLRSAADDTAVEHALKHTNPQYRCPMHPDVVRDEPGNCPICGMTLVKIESPAGPGTPSSSASRAEIRISPAVVNNLGVRTEVVQRGGLARRGEVVGYVGFDERRVQQVRPRADGWVEGLAVRAMGETVQQGQLLFTLYSPMLESAQQEYLDALQIGNEDLIAASRERLRCTGTRCRHRGSAREVGPCRRAGRISRADLRRRDGTRGARRRNAEPGDGCHDDHRTGQSLGNRGRAGVAIGVAATWHASRSPLSVAAGKAGHGQGRVCLSRTEHGDTHAARTDHARETTRRRATQHAREYRFTWRAGGGRDPHTAQRTHPWRWRRPCRRRAGRGQVCRSTRGGRARKRRPRDDS